MHYSCKGIPTYAVDYKTVACIHLSSLISSQLPALLPQLRKQRKCRIFVLTFHSMTILVMYVLSSGVPLTKTFHEPPHYRTSSDDVHLCLGKSTVCILLIGIVRKASRYQKIGTKPDFVSSVGRSLNQSRERVLSCIVPKAEQVSSCLHLHSRGVPSRSLFIMQQLMHACQASYRGSGQLYVS